MRIIRDALKIDGQPLGETNSKWLNDDYVKFIRFAQWRIDRTGEGVLGFITNHSYLDSPTFRGMRQSLMATFDEIYLLDLHGNAKKKEHAPDGGKDENVFDIQQGVAIGLFVRHTKATSKPAQVFHANLWGERGAGPHGGKYGWLAANDVASTRWAELSPKPPFYLFVPRNEMLAEEYETGWKLTDIFPAHSTGIVSKRDRIAFHFERQRLLHVLDDFDTLDEQTLREKYDFRDSRDGKIEFVKEHIQDYGIRDEYIKICLYRPFDCRWTYYTDKSKGFLGWPVYDIMRHMLAGPNLGLCVGRAGQVIGSSMWDVVSVSRHPSDFNLFRRGGNCLFPLYVYPKEFGREPNINQDFITTLSAALGLDFILDGTGDLETAFGPEAVFHYVYAILHSPEYRRRYADFLKSDFPRIPLTSDCALFTKLAALGKQLGALHLMETEGEATPAFPVVGSNRMEKVRYAPPTDDLPGRVWINRDQYFEDVAPATWTFAIGGYRPAEKWLKDRKDRVLSFDDVTHYRTLCAALAETPDLMARIDEIVAVQGGWPLTC